MMGMDSGILLVQASMNTYQADQPLGLWSPENLVECTMDPPCLPSARSSLALNRDRRADIPGVQCQAADGKPSELNQTDLGGSRLAPDAFTSGTSAHLWVSEKCWSTRDPHEGSTGLRIKD